MSLNKDFLTIIKRFYELNVRTNRNLTYRLTQQLYIFNIQDFYFNFLFDNSIIIFLNWMREMGPFYNNINVFILFSRVIHPEDSSDWYWNISLSYCSLLLHIPLHFSFLRREIVPGRFWDWTFLWFHHARWFVFYYGEIYCYCNRSLTQR